MAHMNHGQNSWDDYQMRFVARSVSFDSDFEAKNEGPEENLKQFVRKDRGSRGSSEGYGQPRGNGTASVPKQAPEKSDFWSQIPIGIEIEAERRAQRRQQRRQELAIRAMELDWLGASPARNELSAKEKRLPFWLQPSNRGNAP